MLHFLFDWSGYLYPIGTFSAVNESVWEHLKLGFWPVIFLTPLEYKYIKHLANNFIIAKTIASYTIPLSIVIIFYSYTAILGTNFLLFDILSFIIAAFIGQFLNYKILIFKKLSRRLDIISLILIILLAGLFVIFTFLPPHLPLFQDSTTGLYGIIKN
jgi:hypothetical protein